MITQYLLPDTAEQAVAELASGAAVMGGGTTVMPAVHAGTLDAESATVSRRWPSSRDLTSSLVTAARRMPVSIKV